MKRIYLPILIVFISISCKKSQKTYDYTCYRHHDTEINGVITHTHLDTFNLRNIGGTDIFLYTNLAGHKINDSLTIDTGNSCVVIK